MSLHVFLGEDMVRVRERAHTFLASTTEGAYEQIDAGMMSEEHLKDLAGGASLFGGVEALLVDTPSELPEAFEIVSGFIPLFSESQNTFVIIEGKLKAAEKKILKKHAETFEEVSHEARGAPFNVFSLTEALLRRDKKSLWVLLQRARLAGLSPEELIGTLFWQVKVIRLVARTQNAAEAGLKPFVYSKAKSSLTKYKKEEIDTLSERLVGVYHDGHRGEADIDNALERLVLSI